ncbi:hypothetical protein [Nocardioides sp. OK12]|uniref:hypothetical protein n=1 Tax=Nocardioides sp. OK12 TaxID=2758661 RepID=UPI0021C36FC2|nr:hypothetical protein [Nocardioides sp. OK12]
MTRLTLARWTRVPVPDRLAAPAPSRAVLRGLRLFRWGALATVVSVALGVHGQAEPASPAGPDPVAQVADLMADHRCSTTGFLDGSLPSAALLRTPRGQLRVVSFARGWAAHEGVRPGTLVAVCLGTRAAEDA